MLKKYNRISFLDKKYCNYRFDLFLCKLIQLIYIYTINSHKPIKKIYKKLIFLQKNKKFN